MRIKDADEDGPLIVRRRVAQKRDSGFLLSMRDSAEKKLQPIGVPRGSLSQEGTARATGGAR